MRKILMLLLTFFLFENGVMAIVVKGYVLDVKNKEPLIGAVIFDQENSKINDVVGMDGSFKLSISNEGNHELIVKYIGYEITKKNIFVTSDHKTINLTILLQPKEISLAQVEVVAQQNTETNNYAIHKERTAENVENILSSKSIQLSPDITVANVLSRMSGVTVQRTANSGEGRYAIIRGMDKRYNYTLVDGIKIPSPDDKNRYVPMDIFPADLISNLMVVKALTPDMEGDAIGGVMNLILKDAPPSFLLNANASIGYNQLFFNRPFYQFDHQVVQLKSPAELYGANYPAKVSDFTVDNLKFKPVKPLPNLSGGISIGDRFFHHKLGMILAVSNQVSYSGSDDFFATPRAKPNVNNMPGFEYMTTRYYSTQNNRLGIHNKNDFAIDKNNKIVLYNAYFHLNKYISRNSVETALGTGVGNVITKNRSQSQLESIYNTTLQGFHTLSSSLNFDWSAVYSKAWANNPDDVELQYNSTNINAPMLQGLTHKWSHNTDQDLAGYINAYYKPKFDHGNMGFQIGGMFRHKTRDNYYNEYHLTPQLINNEPQQFTTIDSAKFVFQGYNANLGSPVNQNDYYVIENVGAYYGELKWFVLNKLNVLAGVRVEQTNLHYSTPMPVSFVGRSGSQIYTNILPDIHLRYALTENQNLRLSYFSSISRPGYFEVIPYLVSGEYFDEEGNPYLKPAKASNFDFRYELFPSPSEQILAGFFYKHIKDPIEYSLVQDLGPSSLQLKPQNFGTALNYGFEFVFLKYFKNFGISGNYTFTKSRITTYKASYQRNASGDLVTDSVLVTRPMQGQADNIANLSFLYKNQRLGLDLQLAIVYTGKYISQVSGYEGLDYWSMPFTSMDFSFDQRLAKNGKVHVFGKARNILNAAAITRIFRPNSYLTGTYQLPNQNSPNSVVVQKEVYQPSYLIGVRFSF
ncbi:MAG: TonB-dependent receptor domain-containing protein [Microbacter sp.]